MDPPTGAISRTHRTLIGPNTTPGDNDGTPSTFKITQPGSYYLSGNITGQAGKIGIEITVDDVSIDLMGFELIGVGTTLDGISHTAFSARNISVSNGVIRDWDATGVKLEVASNSRLENLRAFSNGAAGLRIGGFSVVEGCTSFQNTGVGIFAGQTSVLKKCAASFNGSIGMVHNGEGVISDCAASDNTGDGIYVTNGRSTITGCTSIRNGNDGIVAAEGSTVVNNTVVVNGGDGIEIQSGCLVTGNTCHRNGLTAPDGAGIHAIAFGPSADNRIDGNNLTQNDKGLDIDSPGNFIVRNSASGNGTNYDIAASNDYAQIVVSPGAGFVSTDPWANFAF